MSLGLRISYVVTAEADARERQLAGRLVLLMLAGLMLLGILFEIASQIRHREARLLADSAGHFAWGYAWINEGRLDPGPTLKCWDLELDPHFPEREVNGRLVVPDKYPVGWSLAVLPFMAVAKLATMIVGWSVEDARTFHILLMAGRLGALCWACLGLFCGYRALSMLQPPLTAAVSIFFVWIGTSAFAYTWCYPTYSHAVAMGFICISYFAALQCVRGPRAKRWALTCGLAMGMVICCRVLDVVLVLPAAVLLCMRLGEGGGERGRLMRSLHWRPVREVLPAALLAAVGLIGPVLLQMAVWKTVYGLWLYRSYEGEGFVINVGNQIRLLFSSRHGLFFFHPILLFAVGGLILGMVRAGRHRATATFLAMVAGSLLAIALLYGAWHWWSLGWTAGARWAADPLFLWAIGLSIFIERFLRSRPRAVLITMAACAFCSLALLGCYLTKLIPPDDYITVKIPGIGSVELP